MQDINLSVNSLLLDALEERCLGICLNLLYLSEYKIPNFGSYWSYTTFANFSGSLEGVDYGFYYRLSTFKKKDSDHSIG